MRRRLFGYYDRPDSADARIADLYVLHALWITVGSSIDLVGDSLSGPAAYLDQGPVISVKPIGLLFEECLYEYARAAHDAIAEACYREIVNASDAYLVTPSRLNSWLICEATEEIRSCFRRLSDKEHDDRTTGNLQIVTSGWRDFFRKSGGWPSVIRIFQGRFWAEAECYGGERWAVIADKAMGLLNMIKRGDLDELMGAVDGVIRLHHNTGPLFTINKLGYLGVSLETLARIAKMTSKLELLDLASPEVAGLLQRRNTCYPALSVTTTSAR